MPNSVYYAKDNARTHRFGILALILLGALAVRLIPALSLWHSDNTAALSRPDTVGYLAAVELYASGSGLSDGGEATFIRAPGVAWAATPFRLYFGEGDWRIAFSVFLAVVGAATIIPVYFAGREWGNTRTGLLAATLTAFNMTAAANAPLLLSDTLFGGFAALQFMLFVLAWKRHQAGLAAAALGVAGLAALIRPINLAWLAPGLLLLVLMPQVAWKRKVAATLAALLLWAVVPGLWLYRNHCNGAGWCIDTNTGAMLHQNGAMLLSEVTGRGYEEEKQRLLAEEFLAFGDTERFPDAASRENWRKQYFRKLIGEHPVVYLRQQLQWKTILPDVATLSELMGFTRGGRGTMEVLHEAGVWAAARHYFADNLLPLWMLLPWAFYSMLPALGGLAAFIYMGCRIRCYWYQLLMLLAFAEYYLWLPGAITAPRYLIPALPVLAVSTAILYQIIRVRLYRAQATERV
ncbi:MAG: glycosyltransferase family 39 protein [Victivallaceae bacterium]|nr:glycosyltransferase family 39 protein [Victivallaceae bacterium]